VTPSCPGGRTIKNGNGLSDLRATSRRVFHTVPPRVIMACIVRARPSLPAPQAVRLAAL